MSEQNDDGASFVLLVLAAVLALVLTGVLGVAVSTAKRHVASAAGPVATGDAAVRVYFAAGSTALPPAASQALVELADAARQQTERVVLISGLYDARGEDVAGAESARRRSLAVRHALEANGVAPDRLVLDKPAPVGGAPDDRAARSVEIRLR